MSSMSARAAKARIHSHDEVALLDIREHGQYGEGHPFLSVHCPYSSLETELLRLVPHIHAEIILMDDGDGLAQRAVKILCEMGYTRVCWIEGGATAWAAAGYTHFKGVNLPSKTLGELVEHRDQPRMITAEALHHWIESGQSFALFDCRPPGEFSKMTLPGARCVPNGELAHRIGGLVQDPSLPIVITCAGRTRGLIGWAGLAALDLPNPVYAVENGTQGWALAGYSLQRKNARPEMPPVTAESLAQSRTRAEAMMSSHGLREIEPGEFLELAQDPSRCLFLVDVRSEEEFAQGHLPGAEHAWSGQIVQATDLTVGLRRARIVLSDDTGLRAALAAIWLRALGYEPLILRRTRPADLPPSWRQHVPRHPAAEPLQPIPPAEASRLLVSGGATLLDLRSSQAYRRQHPRDAVWGTRARLAGHPRLRPGVSVILVHDDSQQCAFIGRELSEQGVRVLGELHGGLRAWTAAGLDTVASPMDPPDRDCIDFLFFVHDRHDGNLESARRYLEWETGLIAQLDAQEQASFRL